MGNILSFISRREGNSQASSQSRGGAVHGACGTAQHLYDLYDNDCLASGSGSRQGPPGMRTRATGSEDVVGTYTKALTSKVHDMAKTARQFVPQKACEMMSKAKRQQLSDYVNRYVDLLLLEVNEEVKEFVATLKNWPLKWLIQDGRVLLGLTGAQAGEYYGQQVVRFYIAHDDYNSRQDWRPLPRHSLGPGDMVLLTPAEHGPLVSGNWCDKTLYGVVTERAHNWIKVAFQAGPIMEELQDRHTWRLDRSVNTLTTERALLALPALWHRLPFQTHPDSWSWKSFVKRLFGLESIEDQSSDVYETQDITQQGVHKDIFQGSSLSDIIVTADKSFDWASLPAEAGGMPAAAVQVANTVLPTAGTPNKPATAALLKDLKDRQRLLPSGTVVANPFLNLDISQMQAVCTVIVNPLVLLHGPPGTGKTTTIGAVLWYLRRYFNYKGSILAAAQSNVAVDNMLETAMTRGGLKVLRIGEPVKVRSCLQRFTLRAALEQDADIKKARKEQQELRQQLRRAKNGPHLTGCTRRMMYDRLDALTAEIKRETARVTQRLLAEADVVGVTCAGAAGPELADAAFDMVIIDEGSQASEPEALIPLMKGCRRAVLGGDHKQLPPVIKSKTAADAGLNVSLFERLMELGAPSAMLQVQYRSHPALMSFVNKQFYHGLLSDGVSAEQRPPPKNFMSYFKRAPLVFITVNGAEKGNARGSKLNEKEADVIERLVMLLVRRCDMSPGDLGIISPYAAQVSLLSRRLTERGYTVNSRGGQGVDQQEGADGHELEIKSVDGYQGREKDIILLSTVRANGQQQTGFLDDWRRANVALSRARRALVVVGHKGTLRGSSTWRAFLDHAAQQRCVVELEKLTSLAAAR